MNENFPERESIPQPYTNVIVQFSNSQYTSTTPSIRYSELFQSPESDVNIFGFCQRGALNSILREVTWGTCCQMSNQNACLCISIACARKQIEKSVKISSVSFGAIEKQGSASCKRTVSRMNVKFDGLVRTAVPQLRSVSSPSIILGPKSVKIYRVCIKIFVCAKDGRAIEYFYCYKTKKQSCSKTTLKISGERSILKQWGHEPKKSRGHQESQKRLNRAIMLVPTNPGSICGQDSGWS